MTTASCFLAIILSVCSCPSNITRLVLVLLLLGYRTLLKDIFDEWLRERPEGSTVSLAAMMRSSEAACLHVCQHAKCHDVLAWAGHYAIQLKDHDCLEEYSFMGDDAIEKAFDILAPLCAQFGRRPPVPSKFKVPRH